VFADSEEEFESKQKDQLILREFIKRSVELDDINSYLALCEPTSEPKIEKMRSALMDSIVAIYFDQQGKSLSEIRETWLEFKKVYSEFYAEKHDLAIAVGKDNKKLNEFLGSDIWTTFAALSEIPWFGRHDMEMSIVKMRALRIAECDADVRKILETRPFCDCSFRLTNITNGDVQLDDLAYTVAQGIEYFRQKMLAEQSALYLALGEMSKIHQDPETLSKVKDLVPALENNQDFPPLTSSQIHILKNATRKMDMTGAMHTDRRRSPLTSFAGFHPEDWQELENELDSLMDFPVLNS
jgi:DNA-directed RNA polymerase subunit F